MFIIVHTKEFFDLAVFLQKKYKLYFIEFRVAPNGRKAIVFCHPNNKDYWIEILFLNVFKMEIFFGCKNREIEKKIKNEILAKCYRGYGKKYICHWLNL